MKKIIDFYPILKECFSSDNELIEKWHIASGTDLETCVMKTFNDLKSCDKSFQFFKLEKNNKLLGYFGSENIENIKFLTGFFIMPEFRNKDGYSYFWSKVNNHFNDTFLVGVHAKNKRASRFLEKSGGVLIADGIIDDQHGVVYRFGLGV